jgi:hypothetical protein
MPTTGKKFASGTNVSPARSREELDKMLKKYGATGFGYVDQKLAAAIMFELNGRTYRYLVAMPQRESFQRNPSTNLKLSADAQTRAWEQATREQWRALVATIKGMLIAVDYGIKTFEEVFMNHTVMANGQNKARSTCHRTSIDRANRSWRMTSRDGYSLKLRQ